MQQKNPESGRQKEILNPNIEILNKFECSNIKTQTAIIRFEHLIFEF